MASTLPAELWDHCLSLLDPRHLQHTAVALQQALPHTHLSRALLWRNLQVKRQGQALQCITQLRDEDEGTREAVRTVNVEVWRDDTQLLVNLLLSLPAVRAIDFSVGPTAAPDEIEDLVEPAGLTRTGRWKHLEQLSFRYNPYVSERSYYRFLAGAYFDSSVHSLCRLPPSSAPKLTRLSFAQDLPPLHGTIRPETLAFGLHNLGLEDQLDSLQINKIVVPTSGRYNRRTVKTDPREFAQPIVFHQLSCLTALSQSPLGSHLTSLSFRLPKRNLLPSLTDLPISPFHTPPFPFLKHLDLSTTHLVDDARFPLLLRLFSGLEALTLDRCSGLISQGAEEEPNAVAMLRWLGKCIGSIGLSRADDATRSWRRIAKDRPSDAPNVRSSRTSTSTSHSTSTPAPVGDALVPPVKELIVLPPPSALLSLGLGLHDLPPRTALLWRKAFFEGYRDAHKRTVERVEDGIERWERWMTAGKLGEGTRRFVTFEDALSSLGVEGGKGGEEEHEEDPDPTFARFCATRHLVPLSLSHAHELLSLITSLPSSFTLCLTPDCSNAPGVPHLSFAETEEGGRKEDPVLRRRREKEAWEAEDREEEERLGKWGQRHEKGCAHERRRQEWGLGQFS
ncbi:hypothetical protein JCM8547_004199 [Rhodosporidiobolus lusitaniae]